MRYKIEHTKLDDRSAGEIVTETDLFPNDKEGKPAPGLEAGIKRLTDLKAIRPLNRDENAEQDEKEAKAKEDAENADKAQEAPVADAPGPSTPNTASNTPAAPDTTGGLAKMTDDQLRAKAVEIGLTPEQAAAFNRQDLIAAIKQAQTSKQPA